MYAKVLIISILGFATPTIERYSLETLGVMIFVIVWPNT
jgi:hypothetical protein